MTPQRLDFIIDDCFRHRRKAARSAHYQDIARFLQVEPITLRRWRSGERPIPRTVEIIFEIFHAWPEVDAAKIERLIEQRDKETSKA
jgi:hypothetical protein